MDEQNRIGIAMVYSMMKTSMWQCLCCALTISLIPRLSPRANEFSEFSVLQATESWAGPGNTANIPLC